MADFKFDKSDKIRQSARDFNFSLAKTIGLSAFRNVKFGQLNLGLGRSINDNPELYSYLGTPVYDSVTFGEIEAAGQNTYINLQGIEKKYNPIRLTEILIEVTQTKNIVSTTVMGRNGNVHEYISDGDYNISFTGRISGNYNQKTNEFNKSTSQQEVIKSLKILIDICKVGYQIPVTSYFLNYVFGINSIIITDYQIPQQEGRRLSYDINISAVSDNPENLIFTEEDIKDSDKLSSILS